MMKQRIFFKAFSLEKEKIPPEYSTSLIYIHEPSKRILISRLQFTPINGHWNEHIDAPLVPLEKKEAINFNSYRLEVMDDIDLHFKRVTGQNSCNKYNNALIEGSNFTTVDERLPIVLCVDVSGSMAAVTENGIKRIDLLNEAINRLINAIKENALFRHSADFAIVTFGNDCAIAQPFLMIDKMSEVNVDFEERAYSPMGQAIKVSLKLLNLRKMAYKQNGIRYDQPWLIVFTDGEPEGENASHEYDKAVELVNDYVKQLRLSVIKVAIGPDCNLSQLCRLAPNQQTVIYDSHTDFSRVIGNVSLIRWCDDMAIQ